MRDFSRFVTPATATLRRCRWPLLVFGVFLAANHLLLRGRAVPIWDAATQAFPYFVLVADHARAGQFVEWDPWTEAGLPLGGEPQAGAYSPIVVALGFVFGGHAATFIGYWLLVWGLGAFAVLALGHHLGAPPWGSSVVALGVLFCGVYTGNAEHLSWVEAFSFVPLILWRLDVALMTRSLRAAVQAGALWGLSALAGHPAIIMLGGGYAALWALGRLLFGETGLGQRSVPNASVNATEGDRANQSTRASRRVSQRLTLRTLVVMLVVGVVVLAPTYVTTIRDGVGVHSRSGPLPKSEVLVNELPPGALVTIASPFPSRVKFQHQGVLWPRSDVSMVNVYAGVLIPVLALFALVARYRDRWRWWIAALALLSIGCAMGQSLPLHAWLYELFYPVRYFRHSAVFRLFYIVSVTVLALLGTRELELAVETADARSRRVFAWVACASSFAATVAYAWFLLTIRDLPTHRIAPILIATWLGPIAAGVLAWVGRGWLRYMSVLLIAIAVADAFTTSVVSRVTMMSGDWEVRRWQQLERQHRHSLDLTEQGLRRIAASCVGWDPTQWCELNDQLITKVPVQHADVTFKNAIYERFVSDTVLRAASGGDDRIWFSPTAAQVPRTDAAVAAFVRRAHAAGAPPLVVHSRAEMTTPVSQSSGRDGEAVVAERIRELPAARKVAVRVLAYEPNELAFAVDVLEPGWLLVTDRWAPRWQATVDGGPADLFGGGFVYRALRVPSGSSTVRFTYRSSGHPFLVVASWAALVLVLLDAIRRGGRIRPPATVGVSAVEPAGRPEARSD